MLVVDCERIRVLCCVKERCFPVEARLPAVTGFSPHDDLGSRKSQDANPTHEAPQAALICIPRIRASVVCAHGFENLAICQFSRVKH
jgi:hypothetical protein